MMSNAAMAAKAKAERAVRSIGWSCPKEEGEEVSGVCGHNDHQAIKKTFCATGGLLLVVGKNTCRLKPAGLDEKTEHYHETAIEFLVDVGLVKTKIPALQDAVARCIAEKQWKRQCKRAKDPVELCLPDDNAPAFGIVLKILHGADGWPFDSRIEIDALLNLTKLANKYDLLHYLKPWTAKWIKDMEVHWYYGRKFLAESTVELEKLVWIFWYLGHEPLYVHSLTDLAIHTAIDETGALADGGRNLIFSDTLSPVPEVPGVHDEIKRIRLGMLKAIRKEAKELMERHLHGNDEPDGSLCVRGDEFDDSGWRKDILHSMIEMLDEEQIWPLPNSPELKMSPRALVYVFEMNMNIPWFTCSSTEYEKKLKMKNMMSVPGAESEMDAEAIVDIKGKGKATDTKGQGKMRICRANAGFYRKLERMMLDMQITISNCAVEHLHDQAEVSGVYGVAEGASTEKRSPVTVPQSGFGEGVWNQRMVQGMFVMQAEEEDVRNNQAFVEYIRQHGDRHM